jgi:hypothetical protein
VLSKKIVQAAILSLTMAVYSLFLENLWTEWLNQNSYSIGFGEVALGYFAAICFAMTLTWIITRNMGKKE